MRADDLRTLTWDPDQTLDESGERPAPSEAPQVAAETLLVGRYALGELIGRGGSGQVHRASDRVSGEDVAIKFVRPSGTWQRQQLRRELTALRLLDLPGVLRLRDDGEYEDQVFLVMDLAPNGQIDRLAGPWHQVAPTVLAVLETLAQLHAVGVIHRDLKPGNLLLDARDRPLIADFGLALGTGIDRLENQRREGTPAYAAPEQWMAAEADHRSDIYSMGVVLFELLTGDLPSASDVERERTLARAVAPESVRKTVVRMLAADPEDRPQSVREVLVGLGEPEAPWADALPTEAADLEALFDEPRPTLIHVAEDAVAALAQEVERSGLPLATVIGRWERTGHLRWFEGRFHMDREGLEELLWQNTPEAAELARLGRAGDEELLVDRALEVSAREHAAGRPGRSAAVLDSVLAALEDGRLAQELCQALTAAVLELGRESALRRASSRVERWDEPGLVRLLRGALLCAEADFTRAMAVLADPGELDEDLQTWRIGLLAQALGRVDPAGRARWLESVEEWCSRAPGRRASWLSWAGLAAYADGNYAHALQCHHEAAQLLSEHPPRRLTSLANAASSAMEVPDFAQARRFAEQAALLARELRNPVTEGHALWVQRATAYRSGTDHRLQPEPERVDAAAAVSRALEGQVALVEAAIAWRHRVQIARPLALRAASIYQAGHFPAGVAIAQALAAAAGEAVDANRLARTVRGVRDPSLVIQAVALGAAAGLDLGIERAVGLLPDWPLMDPDLRADILSRNECQDLL